MPNPKRDQFSPSESSITERKSLITLNESQTLEPEMDAGAASDLNLHSKPHGLGAPHSSEPSNVIVVYSPIGKLEVSGTSLNLIDVSALSKMLSDMLAILALQAKTNRGLSSKERETITSLENQLLSSPKNGSGIFTYLHLWKTRGKADADDYARRWGLSLELGGQQFPESPNVSGQAALHRGSTTD